MPNPMVKTETYNCQGGINVKISEYIAKEGEFLNLENVDFRVMGALSQAMGSTMITFQNGGLTFNTTISSLSGIGAYNSANYASFALMTTARSSSNNYLFNATGNTFVRVMPLIWDPTSIGLAGGTFNNFSFANGATSFFGANGWDFFTYQGGTSALQFGLPKPQSTGGFTGTGGSNGLSGTLVVYWSLVRTDGLYGPTMSQTFTPTGATTYLIDVPSVYIPSVGSGLSAGSFGISGIQAWVSLNNSQPVGPTLLFGYSGIVAGLTVGINYTGVAGWVVTTPQPYDYQGSFLYGLGLPQGSSGALGVTLGQVNPNLLEYYANQLFTAEFGTNPNRTVYSNPGQPEIADYQNFIDIGDASILTAMKSYFTQLMFWKFNQTWVLTGSGPDTFVLTQISPIYGCIAKNACCVWNQTLWFLDSKGIFEFDGSNVQCVSNKVEAYFQRMNVKAASTTAVILHVKERNEVWCAIPVDGATSNNLIVVFDYLAQGWYVRDAPNAQMNVISALNLGQNKTQVYFPGPSSFVPPGLSFPLSTVSMWQFGSSLTTDNGTAFTCVIKSRFVEGQGGNSVTQQWRQLYVDSVVPPGITFPVKINIYANKSTTVTYSTTMGLSQYQNRIDFGVPAKSIAVEIIYSGATFFQLNGFTLEYRFQRAV